MAQPTVYSAFLFNGILFYQSQWVLTAPTKYVENSVHTYCESHWTKCELLLSTSHWLYMWLGSGCSVWMVIRPFLYSQGRWLRGVSWNGFSLSFLRCRLQQFCARKCGCLWVVTVMRAFCGRQCLFPVADWSFNVFYIWGFLLFLFLWVCQFWKNKDFCFLQNINEPNFCIMFIWNVHTL